MYVYISGPELRVCNENLISLLLNQNIYCGHSKEPSQWDGSFEHPKHMFKNWWVRKYLQFYADNFCLSKVVLTCVCLYIFTSFEGIHLHQHLSILWWHRLVCWFVERKNRYRSSTRIYPFLLPGPWGKLKKITVPVYRVATQYRLQNSLTFHWFFPDFRLFSRPFWKVFIHWQ